MKTLSIFTTEVMSPRQLSERSKYQPRWHDRLRKITTTDVEIVVLKARANKANTIFSMSSVLNTVELLEAILCVLSYRELNNTYYACQGFQRVIRDSLRLRQALFLAPDHNIVGAAKFLPIKIFHPPRDFLRQHDQDSTMVSMTAHIYERLRQPPRLKLLDRFVAQPPLRYLQFFIRVHVPATREQRHRHMYLRNQDGIRLADFMNGIERCLIELFPVRPPYWTISGDFWDGDVIRPPGHFGVRVP